MGIQPHITIVRVSAIESQGKERKMNGNSCNQDNVSRSQEVKPEPGIAQVNFQKHSSSPTKTPNGNMLMSKSGSARPSSMDHKVVRKDSAISNHAVKKDNFTKEGLVLKIKKESHSTQKSNIDPSKKVKHARKEHVVGKEHTKLPASRVNRETEDSDDDIPLAARAKQIEKLKKRTHESDSDDEPLAKRSEKIKREKDKVHHGVTKNHKIHAESPKKRKKSFSESDDELPLSKQKKKKVKEFVKVEHQKDKKKSQGKKLADDKKNEKHGKRKKDKQEQEVWKWWEEDPHPEGVKWLTLQHKGPLCAPPYEPLPDTVKFYYNGKPVKLSPGAEEVASFYSKMLDHDYTTKDIFNTNFFTDWRKEMTHSEKKMITDLKKCNFDEMHQYFKELSEKRKQMTKEEKQEIKLKNEKIMEEYGFCIIDGHKQKIGNFRIEPPGLFRGRGDHPKMGMLKKRIYPEEVMINCSKESEVPKPPAGHNWKEVIHDNKVTWLASWTENVQGQTKYVMLNAATRLKGEKDWAKYETARRLKNHVNKIRTQYREDWRSKEMRIRQRAVALYFIDKLALRAGNEKEEGETADTVGCCSLRVEHIKLHQTHQDMECVVEFDFLGKDSIRYTNSVPVEKRVFKNIKLFMENKQGGDDLFDRLNTSILNKHLQELMEGLTAKVFRTYNASITLQQQLNELTKEDDSVPAKILSYNRANRAVAVLCNHQRSVPKTFEKSMSNLQEKIKKKQDQIKDTKKEYKKIKAEYKSSQNDRLKIACEKKKKSVERLQEQLMKLEVQATDKEENKDIALGTSKLNYLDPRISVAWCKKWDVPVEKVYNKTQREKFQWAIDMAEADFEF